MAELNKSVLGKVSGKIGDLTFRQRNGKNYISIRPSSFIPGQDQASVARRNRFRLASKIAKEILSIDTFKEQWKASTPSGSMPFHNIFKQNYHFIDLNIAFTNMKIFPTSDFNASNKSTTFNEKNVEISINQLGNNSGIDPIIETSLSLISIVYLTNPINPSQITEQFIIIKSQPIPTQLDATVTFIQTIPENQLPIYAEYETKKAFSVLITTDSESKLVKVSNTILS